MKRLFTVVTAVCVLLFVVSCVKKATRDECAAACEKQIAFEQEGAPADAATDPVVTAQADFAAKRAEIEKQKGELEAALDKQYQPKIDKAKKPKEKEKLTAELAAKKAEKTKELQQKLAELDAQKAVALKTVEEQKAKVQAEADKKIAECVDEYVAAGTSKSKADCQAQAANVTVFSECK